MKMEKSLGLIYLGSRGGGVHLTQQLLSELKRLNVDIHLLISSKNEEIERIHNYRSLSVLKLKNFKILNFFQTRKTKKMFRQYCLHLEVCKIKYALFSMPHPLNKYLIKEMQKRGIKVLNIIHDINRHPGDFWPTKKIIIKTIKNSSYNIALSQFVYKEVKKIDPQVILSKLSDETQIIEEVKAPLNFEKYFLFIGRIKKYKGLKNLIKAWEQIDGKHIYLVIAGEGKIPRRAEKNSAVKILNRWLSTAEMYSLIREAQFVVLPYTEASQSGILNIAKKFQTPALIAPVGALPEYLAQGNPGILLASSGVDDLRVGILRAIGKEWTRTKSQDEPESIAGIIDGLLSG